MKGHKLYKVYIAIRGAQKEEKRQERLHSSAPSLRTRLKTATRYGPLVAALVAPTSTLYEIPGLTQPWYKYNGVNVADPTPSLVLSAIGLVLNVSANALLITRFSTSNRWWNPATWASLILWIVKTIIALVNVSIFGTRHGIISTVYTYTEGFWCAVIGVCTSGLISLLLSFHVILHFKNPKAEDKEVRVRGQSFMLIMVSLLTIVALEALIMSRIEGWTFFDGIYFSIITAFTIGLGDFTPTHPISEVLLFPFAILTIAGLANQVAIIVDFLSSRGQQRQLAWQALYEERKEEVSAVIDDDDRSTLRRTTDLEKEMCFLERLAREQELLSMMYGLAWSLAGFVVFWVVGAAIFYAIEEWSYGTSIYFTYIVLLTVGYGTYAPVTAAGRVVFVIYALLAVPIVTSFAVNTVTSLFTTLTTWFMRNRIDKEGLEPSVKPAWKVMHDGGENETEDYHFVSHARLMEEAHKQWEDIKSSTQPRRKRRDTHSEDGDDAENAHGTVSKDADGDVYHNKDEQESNQLALTDRVLELAVQLEDQARTLLLSALKLGSKEQLVLRADKNLQIRDMQYHLSRNQMLNREESGQRQMLYKQKKTMRERAMAAASGSGTTALEQIREYRRTYAKLLATGSRLKRLQGAEQLLFERRRKDKSILVDRYGQPHDVDKKS